MKRFKGPWAALGLAAVSLLLLVYLLWAETAWVGDAGSCRRNLLSLAQAVQAFQGQNEGRIPSRLEQLLPKQLEAVPVCPASGRPSYALFTGLPAPRNDPAQQDGYLISCHGGSHRAYQAGYPAYSRRDGVIVGLPLAERLARLWQRLRNVL